MSDLVTVRVDRETKQKIKKLKIEVSDTVRAALRREIEKKEQEKLKHSLAVAGRLLRKIPEKDLSRIIRESKQSRDER